MDATPKRRVATKKESTPDSTFPIKPNEKAQMIDTKAKEIIKAVYLTKVTHQILQIPTNCNLLPKKTDLPDRVCREYPESPHPKVYRKQEIAQVH